MGVQRHIAASTHHPNIKSFPGVLYNGLIMEMNHPTAGKIAVPGVHPKLLKKVQLGGPYNTGASVHCILHYLHWGIVTLDKDCRLL